MRLTIREKQQRYGLPPIGRGELCPQVQLHVEDEPSGYIAWHEWAEQKAKSHRCKRCPGCGLFTVWVPK